MSNQSVAERAASMRFWAAWRLGKVEEQYGADGSKAAWLEVLDTLTERDIEDLLDTINNLSTPEEERLGDSLFSLLSAVEHRFGAPQLDAEQVRWLDEIVDRLDQIRDNLAGLEVGNEELAEWIASSIDDLIGAIRKRDARMTRQAFERLSLGTNYVEDEPTRRTLRTVLSLGVAGIRILMDTVGIYASFVTLGLVPLPDQLIENHGHERPVIELQAVCPPNSQQDPAE